MPWISRARSGSLCHLLLRVCLHHTIFFSPSPPLPPYSSLDLSCCTFLFLTHLLLPFFLSSISFSLLNFPPRAYRGVRDVDVERVCVFCLCTLSCILFSFSGVTNSFFLSMSNSVIFPSFPWFLNVLYPGKSFKISTSGLKDWKRGPSELWA